MTEQTRVPVTVIYRNSDEETDREEVKIFPSWNIDALLSRDPKAFELPESTIIVKVGTGKKFADKMRLKYNL